MDEDTRLWAKFMLDFADSPKIAGLSDNAFRTMVEMILWSRRFLSDGVISGNVAKRFWKTESLTELVSNDPVKPSLSLDRNGNYVIHDFVEVQGSREDVEARKRRNQANGSKGGRPKKTQSVSKSVPQSVSKSGTDSGTQK